MPVSLVAISLGAALGAISRWLLGEALNSIHPAIPMGTLAANLIGGYIIGLAMSFLAVLPELSPNWRLFIVTGFLGALTTFSTFSAEVGKLIQQERYWLAAIETALHVCGSVAMVSAHSCCSRPFSRVAVSFAFWNKTALFQGLFPMRNYTRSWRLP